MIKKLSAEHIGAFVTYSNGFKKERGKIKEFDNERKVAWVVYHCNEEWEECRWKNYTAACTKYADLTLRK